MFGSNRVRTMKPAITAAAIATWSRCERPSPPPCLPARSAGSPARSSLDLGRGDDRARVSRRQLGGRPIRGHDVVEEAARRRPRPGRRAVAAAPTSSQRRERRGDLGPQRARGRLQVVDQQLAVVERRGPGRRRRAKPLRQPIELLRRSAPTPADRAPRTRRRSPGPRSPGTSTTPKCAGAGSGSTTSPAPPTSAKPGSSWEGTSAPSPAASSPIPSTSPSARRRSAAASALPPPSPAATGIRFSISTRSGRAPPAAGAKRGQRSVGQVRPLDLRADHLVALGLGDDDPIGQGQRAEQRADLVQPVVAARAHVQAEVQLRRRPQRHSASRRASRRA